MTRLLLSLTFFSVMVCHGQTTESGSNLRKRRAVLLKQMSDVKKSLGSAVETRTATAHDLSIIQSRLRDKQKDITAINIQLNVVTHKISQTSINAERLQRELYKLKDEYQKSIVYAYRHRDRFDQLNFLFAVPDFNDALRRLYYLRDYQQFSARQLEDIRHTQKQLNAEMGVMNLNKRKRSLLLGELDFIITRDKQYFDPEKWFR